MTMNNRILASICYFSVFFLGFIFPAVVYFVGGADLELKRHAKRALFSHLLPFIMGVIVFFVLLAQFISSQEITFMPITGILLLFLFGLVSFIVMIWNVVQGVKVLKD